MDAFDVEGLGQPWVSADADADLGACWDEDLDAALAPEDDAMLQQQGEGEEERLVPGTSGCVWTDAEQLALDQALAEFPQSTAGSSCERFVKVAARVGTKTARDCALRSRWMAQQDGRSKRKVDEQPASATTVSKRQSKAPTAGGPGSSGPSSSAAEDDVHAVTLLPSSAPQVDGWRGLIECGDMHLAGTISMSGHAQPHANGGTEPLHQPASRLAPEAGQPPRTSGRANRSAAAAAGAEAGPGPSSLEGLLAPASLEVQPMGGSGGQGVAMPMGNQPSMHPFQTQQQPGGAPTLSSIEALIDANFNILNQFKANMQSFKVVENTQLLASMRDNIAACMSQMAAMGGVMAAQPPLPVQPNMELATRFLPPKLPAMPPPPMAPGMPPPPMAAAMPHPMMMMGMARPPGMAFPPPGFMFPPPGAMPGMPGAPFAPPPMDMAGVAPPMMMMGMPRPAMPFPMPGPMPGGTMPMAMGAMPMMGPMAMGAMPGQPGMPMPMSAPGMEFPPSGAHVVKAEV